MKFGSMQKQRSVSSKILAEMNRVIFEGGGDYPANEFIIGSGKNALLCRYQAEKQILNQKDQLSIEWAGTFRHYHSAMFRTIPIGTLILNMSKCMKLVLKHLKIVRVNLNQATKLVKCLMSR